VDAWDLARNFLWVIPRPGAYSPGPSGGGRTVPFPGSYGLVVFS